MRVGMLFQGSALFDSMSVEETSGFPLICLRMIPGLKTETGRLLP